MHTVCYDIVVIGSGPAGQKAAIQGAKAAQRVLVIEQEPRVGGACVHRGTIPSKTLRHSALTLLNFKRHFGAIAPLTLRPDLELASLMSRLDYVVKAHERYMAEQLARNGITQWHGRARFLAPRLLEILSLDGTCRRVTGEIIVIATGSRPRTPEDIPVDHEHILDSDSLLSILYLPASLTVLAASCTPAAASRASVPGETCPVFLRTSSPRPRARDRADPTHRRRPGSGQARSARARARTGRRRGAVRQTAARRSARQHVLV